MEKAGQQSSAVVSPVQRLHAHNGVLFKLAWSSDAISLVSVSDDRTVQLWSNNVTTDAEQLQQPRTRSLSDLLLTQYASIFERGVIPRVSGMSLSGSAVLSQQVKMGSRSFGISTERVSPRCKDTWANTYGVWPSTLHKQSLQREPVMEQSSYGIAPAAHIVY
ncbi:hypothetical protein PsorP6_014351 [Peronosclerospora sorghi]|uniref:Uncharacterized protein n=1 Tax=Peronosclerospora sorghi TaxID=230839 RepID=A0ACC0VIF0_9STRA|nr:hypothetical protein PsorP6_014351 [Peronosclerospora sorghi]